jgi:tight adherence protein B
VPTGPLLVVYVLAFVAAVLAVQAVAGLFLSARDRSRSVNRRLGMLKAGARPGLIQAALIKRTTAGGARPARLTDIGERLEAFSREAGLKVSPWRLLAYVGAATAALWSLSLVLASRNPGPGLLVNAAASLLAAAMLSGGAAYLWVNRLRTARLRKIEEQLPLALDIIVRGIRAGHPVAATVQLAARELGDPIGSEFGLIVDEYTYGSDLQEALRNFARRTGSSDAHFFAVSVGIQMSTGGNLAEILSGLAAVIRARRTLAKKVKALASEGRASALLLSVLPIFLVSFLMLTQPSYYTDKFSDPLFWPIIFDVVALYFVGWLIIRRITNFRY